MGKLTARKIETLKEAGIYQDGDGLFLVVSKAGSKYWKFRYQFNNKRRDIGLGDYSKLSLLEARELVTGYKVGLKNKIEPISPAQKIQIEKQIELEAAKAKAIKNSMPSFEQRAIQYHKNLIEPVRSKKYSLQWIGDLERYVFPQFGQIPLDKITNQIVIDCMDKFWIDRYVTAKRVLQRILAVMDAAEYPLSKGVITKNLAKPDHKPKNHEALAYDDIADFMKDLRTKQTMSSFALEALILTATRSGEIRGARWCEIDTDKKTWTIPAERMKAKAEHIVPLSEQALAAFEKAKQLATSKPLDLVFEAAKEGKMLSDMTLSKAMKDWGYKATPHGFRSTFRDWIGNETLFDGELAELALAHTIKNAAERAYRRGNMLEKRRNMMIAWADYCDGKTDLGENVIQFRV